MGKPLAYLKQRIGEDWLIGYDSHQFFELSQQYFLDLTQQANREIPPKILLAESNPLRFLAAFLAAATVGYPVFLCNPNWVEQEWQQVFRLVQPDLILGQKVNYPFPIPQFPIPNFQFPIANQIMIPTGGSSGKIRFAIHTWETLMASVRGFQHYFQLNQVNSCCVLPLYHVSGLMQFMRSFTTGGQLIVSSLKELEEGENLNINPTDFFISLVPTQLQRCLQNPRLTSWLSQFQTVLLGGAPAWAELLEQAKLYNIPLALTYGMTETASQVVTLKPKDFLSGNNSCGQVLPHAQVTIRSSTGEILGTNQTGVITIESDSLALGYYSEDLLNLTSLPLCPPLEQGRGREDSRRIRTLKSDDLGFFDDQGYLNVIGRCSNKIITGGENVFPAEVEAAILATQLVADVCVIGLPDPYWGQAVTAVYVPGVPEVSPASLQAVVEDKLSKFKRPKYWVPVERLPRNAQGKVNYEQLKKLTTDLKIGARS